MKDKKKIIILQHGGGELANQLWNFMSVYAYSLETNKICLNYSFFEYGGFFNFPAGNKIIDFIFFKPFRGRIQRRSALLTKTLRNIYKIYVLYIRYFHKGVILSSKNTNNKSFYLPPTPSEGRFLPRIEKNDVVYFDGWLFRNPVGIKKYRREIVNYFEPNTLIKNKISNIISDMKKKYDHVIGVHIRQSDYKEFKGGKYLMEQKRVREILDEYIIFSKKNVSQMHFLITSDGKIDEQNFKDLNYTISNNNAIEDLFLLSKTDTIIGSDSSFGEFSAYYGDIPHIIFKNEQMDWKYYEGKNKYFQNKYCGMVNY